MLKDQTRRLALRVAHDVQQGYDIGPARQVLKDLDLALYLLLLDRLQHLDDAFLVVDDVDALKDVTVLPPADLLDDFVILQDAPRDVHAVVVPVRSWHVLVDVGVDARHDGDRLDGVGERDTISRKERDLYNSTSKVSRLGLSRAC